MGFKLILQVDDFGINLMKEFFSLLLKILVFFF